jgi:hypothetical protein
MSVQQIPDAEEPISLEFDVPLLIGFIVRSTFYIVRKEVGKGYMD